MKSVSESLVTYYSAHPRVLPWRSDPSPYHVWVSEIMLQQTRVDTVKGYYLRFMDAYPDVASLAKAKEDAYLKLWEGLGYYSRVRNMHRAAVEIMEKYQGVIPGEVEELLSLPGIGLYTANAISAIAFHQKAIALDGNLLRVYARVHALPLDPKSEKDKETARKGWMKELDCDPSLFNQALMDVGQNICLPHGAPHCSECPLKGFCKAHKKNQEADYPLLSKPLKKSEEDRTIIFLYQGDSLYLEKRPSQGLLSSLYQPVNLDGHLREEEVQKWIKDKGYTCVSFENLGTAKHIFSHKVWHMIGYRAEVKGPKEGFVNAETRRKECSIPSAFSYFLAN